MISKKTRLKQLVSERRAQVELLNSMVRELLKQLKSTSHPFIQSSVLENLVTNIDKLVEHSDALISGLPDEIDDDDIVALLGSRQGEKTARSILSVRKEIERSIESWHDNNSAAIVAVEMEEASEEVIAQRSMNYQFTAICRMAEAVVDTNWSIINLHYLQFWVFNDQFDYAGNTKKKGGSDDE